MDLRCLIVLAAGPHNDISWRCPCVLGLLVRVVSHICSFGKAKDRFRNTTQVARGVCGQSAQETLARFFGQVGLLQNTLGRVDVWQIHDRSAVARVKDSCKAHASLKRLDDAEVDLVVDDVSCLLMVDWVDDFVGAIVFIAVNVLGLTAVSWVA